MCTPILRSRHTESLHIWRVKHWQSIFLHQFDLICTQDDTACPTTPLQPNRYDQIRWPVARRCCRRQSARGWFSLCWRHPNYSGRIVYQEWSYCLRRECLQIIATPVLYNDSQCTWGYMRSGCNPWIYHSIYGVDILVSVDCYAYWSVTYVRSRYRWNTLIEICIRTFEK